MKDSGMHPKSSFLLQVEHMLEQYRRLYDGNCPYVLNPPLTAEHIAHFEAAAHIELPQDYRDFLLHIGDGGKQKRQFPLPLSRARDCLEEDNHHVDGIDIMSLPFSVESCNLYYGEEFDDIDDDISDEALEKLKREALQGTLTVHNDGCGYYMVLIVSGALAGQLYDIDTCHGQGARKVSDSFGEYYIEWLQQKITERLAFLEQNDKFECIITKVKLGGNVRDLHVRKRDNGFAFSFEFFCPGDFIREGGYSEYTQVGDQLVVSLSMEHKSYLPLEIEKVDETSATGSLPPLTLLGERSLHAVIGQVNRLFVHDTGVPCFPLYVEGLEQEVLVKGLRDMTVSVGEVYKLTGQLNGEIYKITR